MKRLESALFPALAMLSTISGCVGKAQYNDTVASYHQISNELVRTKEERDQCKARITDMERRVSESEERAQELTQTNQLLLSKNRSYAEKSLSNQKEVLKFKQERQTRDDRASSLARMGDDFSRSFAEEISAGSVRVEKTDDEVVLSISDDVLFVPGTLQLVKSATGVLKKAALVLKRAKQEALLIESHTDTSLSPKQKKLFGSLWELSSLRASRIVRALSGQGVDEKRMRAVGRGPYQPVAASDIHENRLQNRRIEIHVVAP